MMNDNFEATKSTGSAINTMMVWVTCVTVLLLIVPWNRFAPEIAMRVETYYTYIVTALFIEVTNFIARFFMKIWNSIAQKKVREENERIIRERISSMDYAEKALVREFVLQRKSALELPINQAAVSGLKNRGILYQQTAPNENGKAYFCVSRLARPFISYKILGLSTGKMTAEQWEQIMLERPLYARPVQKIRHVYRSGAFRAA